MVARLAQEKAQAAVTDLGRDPEPAIVIGADTTVLLDDDVLGKPGTPAAAAEMLRRLNGRMHRVLTGVALIRVPDGLTKSIVEETSVLFATMSQQEIDDYVATGEPLDKAGAYGIQELGGKFVTSIEGDYFNVVGLPIARVCQLLKELKG